MGHKSVRQLYFIEDEMDAVDVYNRLRSHLLTTEYPLKLNPAFRSCDAVVSILAFVIAFISEILSTLGAAFARIR